MGNPGTPEAAIRLLAITYQSGISKTMLFQEIAPKFGAVHLFSDVFQFNHSQYYQVEMGDKLQKLYLIYSGLFDVSGAVADKLMAISVEDAYRQDNKRRINLDPGYLTLAKLVLTTTKNYDHRLWLADGIFGDIQLRYRRQKWTSNPWTYPDYKADASIEFFNRARAYLQELVTSHETHL